MLRRVATPPHLQTRRPPTSVRAAAIPAAPIKTSGKPEPAGGTPDGARYDTDEYGVPYTSTRRYSWLGDKQRSADALAGTLLRGVRVYLPILGRLFYAENRSVASDLQILRRTASVVLKRAGAR